MVKRRDAGPGARSPGLGACAAAIVGAVGFAVAQPLYDMLGRHAAFFVAHQADGRDLLAFCAVLSLGLPLALTLVVAGLGRLHEGVGRWALAAVLGVCGALLLLAVARSLELPGAAAIPLALAVGAFLALLSRKDRVVRGLALLGIGGLVFPALFLAGPEARALADDGETSGEAPAAARAFTSPVVIVVFDEMPTASLLTPDAEIDAGRFPNFARLAATATWYRQATTVSQATIYSVPAILTGSYPEARVRKSPIFKHYRSNVFTRLADEGLPMNVWETMTNLCPRRICEQPERWRIPRPERLAGMLSDSAAVLMTLVAPADWRGDLPALEDQWRDFWRSGRSSPPQRAPRTTVERRESPGALFDWFLNTIEQHGSEPALHFAHVVLPHRPWVWLPSGQNFESHFAYPHGMVNQFWRGTEWETTQAQQRHLLTLGYVDRLVGNLHDTLESSGAFDDALIVITSDHGSAFATGGLRRNLRREPTYEIAGVPLIVKYPGQTAGEIDDRNAETIDIVPTILAALGRETPESLDGRDLRGPTGAKGQVKKTFLSGNKRSTAGGILEYRTSELSARQEALDTIARRFGNGSWERLFAAGPRPDLVGRWLRDLEVAPADAGERAEIADLEAWDDVDPRANVLPIHLLGRLSPHPADEARALAVALDGRIRGTTETFETDEGPSFTALLPPEALRPGGQRLEVLLIEGQGDATALRRLDLVPLEREDE